MRDEVDDYLDDLFALVLAAAAAVAIREVACARRL